MSFPAAPPVGGTPRPWQFPPAQTRTLPWGLRIAAVRMPALPIVHVRWSFRSGRGLEPADRVGVGRMLSAVARHGTERWDSSGLAHTVDHLGARLSTAVGGDNAIVSVTALAEHFGAALDIVDEVALRPTFPEADLARERDKALQLMRHERSQAAHLAGMWLGRALYGSHPYGRPVTTEAGLGAVDRAALSAFHHAVADPRGAMLLVVGDIDPEAVLDQLADRHAAPPAWAAGPLRTSLDLPPCAPPAHPRRIAADRPGAEQCAIAVGQVLFDRSHPDYLPVRLANQVLGGSASSRLFMELRERRSLTYGCYSSLDLGLLGGDFSASLSCSPDKAAEAVEALQDELRKAATGDIEADELEHARQYLVGAFPQSASGVGGVAALVNRVWLHDLPEHTWVSYQQDLVAVSLDRVNEALRRWLDPDQLSWVVVGPGEPAAAALAPVGLVELRPPGDAGYEAD